jgi:hypothetical protein
MTKEELDKLYFRDDPDSKEARYSPEIGKDIDVDTKVFNEVREKLIEEMKENLKKGYQVFIQNLR